MQRNSGEGDAGQAAAVRDHLANERTLLAWQRTALAIMGLGFVVDRFALGNASGSATSGGWIGLVLIVVGGAVSLLGARRFVQTEREIDTATYRPSVWTHLVLTGAVVLGALALLVYLVLTPVP